MIISKNKHTACGLLLIFFLGLTGIVSAQPENNKGYNVKSYGAKGDGISFDHAAINKAIADCAANGGGTVIVPQGKYLCGSIRLKSNINLLLESGAVIRGAEAGSNVYDTAEAFPHTAYQDGGHTYFHNSLIWGEDLVNVSITGKGLIDGGGLTKEDKEKGGIIAEGNIGTGDKAIALKRCRNVLIRDITIFHGGHFAIIITGCDLATIDNVTIDTNRDGIDIDCCTNTTVTDCRVNTPGDDAICIKSSYALNQKVISENILITGCTVSGFQEGTLLDGKRIPVKASWANGRIKFGTESNGGFRNCVVSDCIFISCNGLALEIVDGGIMENMLVSNLLMTNIYYYPIYITLGKRTRGPSASTGTGTIRNIQISNIHVSEADSFGGIQITGLPEKKIEKLSLSDITVTYKGGGTAAQGNRVFPELGASYPEASRTGINPAYGIFIGNVNDIKLRNIQFYTDKPDLRPSIIAENIDGLHINNYNAAVANPADVFRFRNIEDLNIIDSKILNQTSK